MTSTELPSDVDLRSSEGDRVDGAELPPGVEYVMIHWVDIHGVGKAKVVPAAAWPDACAPGGGAGFAAFAAGGFARGPEHPELIASPDPSTLVVLPHRPDTAVAFSTVMDGDEIAGCDTRAALARIQREATDRGLKPLFGMEPEFFLLREQEDGTIGTFDVLDELAKPCYDVKALLRMSPILTDIVAIVEELGWSVSALDHEDANGQYEINFDYHEAVTTADRFTLLRTIIDDVARRHGAIASFMPKPLPDRTGSGAHIHMSVQDADGNNRFRDDDDPRGLGLSKTGYSFLAGLIEHGRALAALAMPTVNSYKRIHPAGGTSGTTWSPNQLVYGGNNRTTMLRVVGPGRFENRAIDSSCNAYLAGAAMLAAGLDGIDRELDPGDPVDGAKRSADVPTMPRTLIEALDDLAADDVLRAALGSELVDEFIAVKQAEWGRYMESISRWEIDTYMRRA